MCLRIMIVWAKECDVNNRTEGMVKTGLVHGGSGHGSAVHYIIRSLNNGKI